MLKLDEMYIFVEKLDQKEENLSAKEIESYFKSFPRKFPRPNEFNNKVYYIELFLRKNSTNTLSILPEKGRNRSISKYLIMFSVTDIQM
jgi:hypothetical protein